MRLSKFQKELSKDGAFGVTEKKKLETAKKKLLLQARQKIEERRHELEKNESAARSLQKNEENIVKENPSALKEKRELKRKSTYKKSKSEESSSKRKSLDTTLPKKTNSIFVWTSVGLLLLVLGGGFLWYQGMIPIPGVKHNITKGAKDKSFKLNDEQKESKIEKSETQKTRVPLKKWANKLPKKTLDLLFKQLENPRPWKIRCEEFTCSFDEKGVLNSMIKGNNDLNIVLHGRPYAPFEGHLRDASGIDHSFIFKEVARYKNYIIMREQGIVVIYEISEKSDYVTFRIRHVQETDSPKLMQLHFSLKANQVSQMRRLDWMTYVRVHGVISKASWKWIYDRNEHNPLGAVAFHFVDSPEQEDSILMKLWVHEGLPRPNVPGQWTIEKAEAWLGLWQKRYVDQSAMVIKSDSPEERDFLTEKAASLGMKKIYLHADTWRGEYWPTQKSFLYVNRNSFPAGEKDLRDYGERLRKKGMSLAIHMVSGIIAMKDPDYILSGVDSRLARWIELELLENINEQTQEFRLRPLTNKKMPKIITHDWFGPNCMPKWMRTRVFRIGEEFFTCDRIEDGDEWVFRSVKRGHAETKQVAHSAGSKVVGYLTPYNQSYIADVDSDLLPEITERFANFCMRNNIDHLECDGLENYSHKGWGSDKFGWMLYERMGKPCVSNTSSGDPLPFHMEYLFNSSREVKKNLPTGGIAGGEGIPVFSHHDERPATGPYEGLLKPSYRISQGGRSFNLMRPIPMFGISKKLYREHGLMPTFETYLKGWRSVAELIDEQQINLVKSSFGVFTSPISEGTQHAATDILYRPSQNKNGLVLESLQMMKRSGEKQYRWGWGQEFGPLIPMQSVKMDQQLKLLNPHIKQVPEFVIRVRHTLKDKPPSLRESRKNESKDIATEQYEIGAMRDPNKHPLTDASYIWSPDHLKNAKKTHVYFRRSIDVDDMDKLLEATLYLHVDEWAAFYMNGREVFGGGHPYQTIVVDLSRHMQQGKNLLAIRGNNGHMNPSYAMAVHLQYEDRLEVVLSDESWLCDLNPPWGEWVKKDFNDSKWANVKLFGKYGVVGKKGALLPAVVNSDLIPKDSRSLTVNASQEMTLRNNKLNFSAENVTNQPKVLKEQRGHWRLSADMFGARGIEFDITGDGSNGIFVVTVYGAGKRDYVVKLDFSGRKKVVIPHGEVAWGESCWGWRRATGHMKYSIVRMVQAGLGWIPPKSKSRVQLHAMKLLYEHDVQLKGLVIRMNQGTLSLQGTVSSDQYLWYRGGNDIGIYDLNWNKLSDVPVLLNGFMADSGENKFSLENRQQEEKPWFDLQLMVKGNSIKLKPRY